VLCHIEGRLSPSSWSRNADSKRRRTHRDDRNDEGGFRRIRPRPLRQSPRHAITSSRFCSHPSPAPSPCTAG
jgi:hypothetical protein